MIVPMKKVSLFMLASRKKEALKKLRRLGLLQIEITEGRGDRVQRIKEEISALERCVFSLGKPGKDAAGGDMPPEEALALAREVAALSEEKQKLHAERSALQAELARLQPWGEIDPGELGALEGEGIGLGLYEMPASEYDALGDDVKTLRLERSKNSVKGAAVSLKGEGNGLPPASYRLKLPACSTSEIRGRIARAESRMAEIDGLIASHAKDILPLKSAIASLEKELQFEVYNSGMPEEGLPAGDGEVRLAYFRGYIETENAGRLMQAAKENSWGLLIEDPTEEDNVPTKLKNNRLVSLIYPITDFLGTVPGYFEFDISGWFLLFILIFFGIIFGDGGYGLIVSAVSAALILKSRAGKKPVPPAFVLVGLFGLSTVLWGVLTCTWFGISPEYLPQWLKSLSVPFISNVYSDRLWYPFGPGGAGLTTSQNLQIFCFTLALVQLVIAHIKCALRNRSSLKVIGDIGSVMQLVGMYYVVLSLVVNSAVFPFGLVVNGVPVGTIAISLVGIGFALNFVFANYEGSIGKSVLASLVDIVSVLLGVVNVFSDIVSYIRLWAVGLAGSAISATVNELAGPLLGNFMFMVLAIVLLVFGHGLNMILNVLSVIVHGIRLNTLEFSSHLNMSWSGHKFQPFEE